ncbi:hypothetical protein, partial [Rossellomorea marisflavi]|uniref:hypothetical protein n=1 Tax=Rossellomorea marisflavi TaxID=189381 RepID=UPI00295F0E7E
KSSFGFLNVSPQLKYGKWSGTAIRMFLNPMDYGQHYSSMICSGPEQKVKELGVHRPTLLVYQ